MNSHSRIDRPAPYEAVTRRSIERIASLLSHEEDLHLGMAVFDLWAAFDELVDPLYPPAPPQLMWIEDAGQSLRLVQADLASAIAVAPTPAQALASGRAARHVANALVIVERAS